MSIIRPTDNFLETIELASLSIPGIPWYIIILPNYYKEFDNLLVLMSRDSYSSNVIPAWVYLSGIYIHIHN